MRFLWRRPIHALNYSLHVLNRKYCVYVDKTLHSVQSRMYVSRAYLPYVR